MGTGDDYKKAFDYGWNSITKGATTGHSGSVNIGGGIPFIKEDDEEKKKNSDVVQNTSCEVSVDVGGSASTSSSIQKRMLLDMNGDGLADVMEISSEQNDLENTIIW